MITDTQVKTELAIRLVNRMMDSKNRIVPALDNKDMHQLLFDRMVDVLVAEVSAQDLIVELMGPRK